MQVKQKMHKQPSQATSDIESTKLYGKHTNGRQDSHDIHGQPNNTRLASKRQHPHTLLIEEIRRKLKEMRKTNWKIELRWIKAHTVIRGMS